MKAPRHDYETAGYLLLCFAATVAWVIFLACVAIRFFKSLPL